MVVQSDFGFKGYRGKFSLEEGHVFCDNGYLTIDNPTMIIDGIETEFFMNLMKIDIQKDHEIIDFYNMYSPLAYVPYSYKGNDGEPIYLAKARIECFQLVFNLSRTIKEKNHIEIEKLVKRSLSVLRINPEFYQSPSSSIDESKIKELTEELFDCAEDSGYLSGQSRMNLENYFFNCDTKQPYITSDLFDFACYLVIHIINYHIKDVRPILDFSRGKATGNWKARQPITAIYFEFYLSLCKDDIFKPCAYKKCKKDKYFKISGADYRKKYCSTECQNAAAVEKLRQSDKYKAAQAAKKAAKKVGEKHGTDN